MGRFLEVATALPDFCAETVEAAVGCKFALDHKNQFFSILRAQTWPPFSTMELRAPIDKERRAGLLIADFSDPLRTEGIAPFLKPLIFLEATTDPPPFGRPSTGDWFPTGARWFKLGPHKLAVCEYYANPTQVTGLVVHGFEA